MILCEQVCIVKYEIQTLALLCQRQWKTITLVSNESDHEGSHPNLSEYGDLGERILFLNLFLVQSLSARKLYCHWTIYFLIN